MKFRKITCQYCDYTGRPIKGTTGRVKHKGITKLCPVCRGIVAQ